MYFANKFYRVIAVALVMDLVHKRNRSKKKLGPILEQERIADPQNLEVRCLSISVDRQFLFLRIHPLVSGLPCPGTPAVPVPQFVLIHVLEGELP